MSTADDDQNPYELLGVTLESTEAEIRKAYRQRSLKVHPDRVRSLICISIMTQYLTCSRSLIRILIIEMQVCLLSFSNIKRDQVST